MMREDKARLWQQRLERYQHANTTVADFCEQEGVSLFTFYYWRKRLGLQQPNKPHARFQPLHLTPMPSNTLIELPNGVRIHLPADQPQLLHRLLEQLAQMPRDGGQQ